jgi:4-hydroxybenzoate polyprenyltransferase
MHAKLQTLIELATPQYLIITLISPIAAYLITVGTFPTIAIAPILILLSLAAIWFNTSNMVFDAELDKMSKPLRPIPSGKISVNEVNVFSNTILLIFLISSLIFSVTFFILAVLFVIIGFLYSHPSVNLKKYFWGSSVTGTILYGLIPFLSIHSIVFADVNIPFLIFFSILILIISNSKDFEDFTAEIDFGINSIQTKFGLFNSAKAIIILLIISVASMAILAIYNIIPEKFIAASAISIIIVTLVSKPFWQEIKSLHFKDVIANKMNKPELKTIITQSQAVTIMVSATILIEIIYGLVAML